MSQPVTTFQAALDILEALSESQQDDLIGILQRRRHEKRREILACRAAAARAEHDKGNVERGTAAEFLKALAV